MNDRNSVSREQYIILDNIRSALNVGAIFRTAEGAGVKKIFLGGYTPKPIDRFGRKVSEIEKTSLGASRMVVWEAVNDIVGFIKQLQEDGVQVVAVELSSEAVSLYEFMPERKVAFVFGNEVSGVSNEVLAVCDMVVKIPMRGKKESLNVATTVGIIVFHHPPK